MFDIPVREGLSELLATLQGAVYQARDFVNFAGTPGLVMAGVAVLMLVLMLRRR